MTDYVFDAECFHFHKFHLTKFDEMNFPRRRPIRQSNYSHDTISLCASLFEFECKKEQKHLIIRRCSHLLTSTPFTRSLSSGVNDGNRINNNYFVMKTDSTHARVIKTIALPRHPNVENIIKFRFENGEERAKFMRHSFTVENMSPYPYIQRIKVFVTSIPINHVKRK